MLTWANYRDWTPGELVTALMMNQQIRDPGNMLKTFLGTEATFTNTGNLDDFAFADAALVRFNNASLATIRGLSAGFAGQKVTIVSVGAGQVDLANQNTNSAAANRISNGVTGTISLAPGSGRVVLQYDDTTDRWRVVVHDQGAWITPTFSAANYSGTAPLTWTVGAGDIVAQRYFLRGRTLTVLFELTTTSTGGTAAASLNITNGAWGGFTASYGRGHFSYFDNGGAWAVGHALASSSAINLSKVDFSNWSNASANNTAVTGTVTMEVT